MNNQDIFSVAKNPLRTIEFRTILNSLNPDEKAAWINLRGQWGESLLHWISLSDLGLTMDLLNQGFDINLKDNDGRSPLDWLTDRIYFSFLSEDNLQTFEIQTNLKKITDSIGSFLISRGAIGFNTNSLEVWAKTGLLGLLEAYQNYNHLKNIEITEQKFSPIHYFPFIKFNTENDRQSYLENILKLGTHINHGSINGYTPLHIAVEQWDLGLVEPQSIQTLIANGADIDIENLEGQTPVDILFYKNPQKVFELQKITDCI